MRGRKKLPYTRVPVSFALPEDLVRSFDAYCETIGASKVAMFELALRRFLRDEDAAPAKPDA